MTRDDIRAAIATITAGIIDGIAIALTEQHEIER